MKKSSPSSVSDSISMLAATSSAPGRTTAASARGPAFPNGKNGKKSAAAAAVQKPSIARSSDLGTGGRDHIDLEQILLALTSLKRGDFSVRLPVTLTGAAGRVADAFNDVAELLSSTTDD